MFLCTSKVLVRVPLTATQIRLISKKAPFNITELNKLLSQESSSSLEDLKKTTQTSPQKRERLVRTPRSPSSNNQNKPFKSQFNKQSDRPGAYPSKFNKFNSSNNQKHIEDPLYFLSETRYNPETFRYKESQSALENEYMTAKIKEVSEVSPGFKIIRYTDDDGLKTQRLKFLINSLQPDELFDIVNIQEIDNVKYPFIRIVNKEAALKNYNEKLAQEKSKLYGRTREKRREAGIKYLKVSWSISFSDLEHQKTNEILGLLKKDQKVVVIVNKKENLHRNLTELLELNKQKKQQGADPLNELELLKREKILNHLKSLEHQKMDVAGDIETGLVITISPNSNTPLSEEEKKSKKNEKKLERQLKQKRREEQKKEATAAKSEVLNSTIES